VTQTPPARTAVVAVGGNALMRAGEKGTIAEQVANSRRTARAVVGLLRAGFRLVVTHGNGPQVGAALLRSERAAAQVPPLPLDVCGAATQGEIGYILQQSLRRELGAAGLAVPVVTLVSQTLVSRDDPAFREPTKPIGPFYLREEAEERRRTLGWSIVDDAARGYRRVVASPEPTQIIEEDVIRLLLREGVLVIAAGGGGIPVVQDGRDGVTGVEAVVDKDRASALLAVHLGVDLFVILTDADHVYVNFRKPAQRALCRVTARELGMLHGEGHFPAGNMGPKVEAALRFVRESGGDALITSSERLLDALRGTAGTRVVPDTAFG
jgi:carbamate kinase